MTLKDSNVLQDNESDEEDGEGLRGDMLENVELQSAFK